MALFVALGVLSFLGDRTLFWVYVATITPFLLLHALYLCPRCTNYSCAMNPRSPVFFLRRRHEDPRSATTFSDHPILWTALPMSVSGVAATVGAWMFSPALTVAAAVFTVGVHRLYVRNTCRNCTNDCPGNGNAAYWAWKRPGSRRAVATARRASARTAAGAAEGDRTA